MRYDLAGTSYKSSAASVGNSRGCPALGCRGYELMQDLDFDRNDNGRTWSGNGDDGYILDSGDSQADYFLVENDGTGGWLPIGAARNPFVAVFEGNGHSIRNLAIRRNQEYIGLFGAIGGEAAIRNLGLIDNLADYSGSGITFILRHLYIGGLVGRQVDGLITASYATGAAYGGGYEAFDRVGGLVGLQDGGLITASYATGAVQGGNVSWTSDVGGLVGQQNGGVITASYATGAVDGGNDDDFVGGLVGWQSGGVITASYATGAAESGDGRYASASGLVGLQDGGLITASYGGFGEAEGERPGHDGSTKPAGVSAAAQLTAANAGAA